MAEAAGAPCPAEMAAVGAKVEASSDPREVMGGFGVSCRAETGVRVEEKEALAATEARAARVTETAEEAPGAADILAGGT